MFDLKKPSDQDFKISRSRVQVILDAKSPSREDRYFNEIAIFLYITIGALIALSIFVFTLHQKELRNIKELAQRVSSLSNSKAALETALKKNVRAKRSYLNLFKEETKKNRAFSAQIAQLSILKTFNENRIDAIDAALKSSQKEGAALKDELGRIYQERNFLQERVAALQNMEENLRNKINRILTKTKIELGEVVVTPSAINGKVLRADNKYNFVVIDIGKNDGVKEGATLIAYRHDKKTGPITVEKVYDEFCVGKANFQWIGGELDVGDTVRGKE